jgi:putative tricarboxylic transport membrane protein
MGRLMGMRRRDLVSGLFFLLTGLTFIVGSFRYVTWDRYGPGPGFFPLALGVLFSALCLVLVVANVRNKKDKVLELAASDTLALSSIGKTIAYMVLLFGFYLFFNRLGCMVTIFLFMVITLLLFGKRSISVSLSLSALTAMMVYVIFVRLLGVPLPGGILQNLLRFY